MQIIVADLKYIVQNLFISEIISTFVNDYVCLYMAK